ncbi:hypothetical protein J6590_058352 [Homalodisca vitripennis]|nr:hypothetical protein J6590_058352 [Homalodisca vitripennis]
MIGAVNAAVKMATEEVQWIGPAPLPPAGKLQCYLPDEEGPLCVLLYHCLVTIEMIGAVNAAVKMATEEVQWIGPAPLPPAGKLRERRGPPGKSIAPVKCDKDGAIRGRECDRERESAASLPTLSIVANNMLPPTTHIRSVCQCWHPLVFVDSHGNSPAEVKFP